MASVLMSADRVAMGCAEELHLCDRSDADRIAKLTTLLTLAHMAGQAGQPVHLDQADAALIHRGMASAQTALNEIALHSPPSAKPGWG